MMEAVVYADNDIGVGPVKTIQFEKEIDQKMVKKGKSLFKRVCVQCHKIDKKDKGIQLLAITKRRKPEWIMNMILNPIEMAKKDPTAKILLEKLTIQMPNQKFSEAEARSILEFFRDNDKNLTDQEIKEVPDFSK